MTEEKIRQQKREAWIKRTAKKMGEDQAKAILKKLNTGENKKKGTWDIMDERDMDGKYVGLD